MSQRSRAARRGRVRSALSRVGGGPGRPGAGPRLAAHPPRLAAARAAPPVPAGGEAGARLRLHGRRVHPAAAAGRRRRRRVRHLARRHRPGQAVPGPRRTARVHHGATRSGPVRPDLLQRGAGARRGRFGPCRRADRVPGRRADRWWGRRRWEKSRREPGTKRFYNELVLKRALSPWGRVRVHRFYRSPVRNLLPLKQQSTAVFIFQVTPPNLPDAR